MRRLNALPLLLLVAFSALWPGRAAAVGPEATLASLEQSIRAAMAQAQSLREDLAREPVVNLGADIAGIADGGLGSSLATLRLSTRAVDRRLETLRLEARAAKARKPAMPRDDNLKRAELMLAMRTQLGTAAWAIEEIPRHAEAGPVGRTAQQAAMDTLEQALAGLGQAVTAMAALD